jgi:hypothetical protein
MLNNIATRARHLARRLFVGAAIAALLLSMAACTASSSASPGSSSATSQARRLALGTLRLEGTPQAVDSQSAAQLLPLWQLMAELSTSSAAAPQEIAAVVDQIQATMTAEQIGAIDDMALSAGDLTGPAAAASSSTSASGDAAGAPVDAVIGGGVPPAGGGGIPGGQGGVPPGPPGQGSGSSSGSTTTTAASSIFEQVVSLLQSKVQDVPAQ